MSLSNVARLDTIEGLPDSTPLIANPDALRERWEQDGVLYFRNAVDPDAIAAVRDAYMDRLKEVGAVAETATQPVWTGVTQIDGKQATKIGDTIWKELVGHSSFDHVIREFLGGQPSWVPIVVHRASPPSKMDTIVDVFQTRHQDGVFNCGINFITCWVPLMNIDAAVGGLAVVPGSHKRSYYDYTGPFPGRAESIAPGKIPDDLWCRPDYKVGDILMFHSMTAHAGLPNRSDLFRLSIDVRYLPVSEPSPLIGNVTGFEGATVEIAEDSGETLRFDIDEKTMVRGPKGSRVTGAEMSDVLFEGANVIAVPDHDGHARLVRSVSRKYLDLPAAWFTELPAGWVS